MRLTRVFATAGPYAAGAGIAALAVALQWAVRPLVGDRIPFLFVLAGLGTCAVLVGRGPALIVAAVGALNAVLASGSPGEWLARPENPAILMIYLSLAVLVALFGGELRVTSRRAALAESRLSLAQDETGIGLFELDFEANTAYVTASLCQLLGQPLMHGPIDLDTWLEGLHPGHVEDSRRAMRERLAAGQVRYEREQRIELARGGERWLLTRVRLDASPDGRLLQARGATVDITARKQVEELLEATQRELRQQVADLERLHALSQRLVAFGEELATPLKQVLELMLEFHGARHGLISLWEPEERRLKVLAHAGLRTEALECASEAVAPDAAADTGAEVAVLRAPAQRAPDPQMLARHRALAAAQGLRALYDVPLPAGRVIGALTVMLDAPRVLTERQIRLSEVCAATAAAVIERDASRSAAALLEKRFEVTLESSAVPFTILEPIREAPDEAIVDFSWSYLNPAAARALERPVAALMGRRIGEILPEAWDLPHLFENCVAVAERGAAQEFELPTTAGGWLHVIASPLQGRVAVWFANITKAKRLEEALRTADRRKDEFLAVLAHELRNPLAPIRQAASIARSPGATDSQRERSHAIIERQVRNMSLLLEDLLDVSRISRGTLLLRKVPAMLGEVIEGALEIARPHIEAKQHSVEVDSAHAGMVLEVDPLRMSQVLGNLVTNAAKYTDPGGRIQISAELEDEALAIRVADNGIGLSDEQRSLLFGMFSQVPGSLGRSQGGLGIGLALSRALIELHGGRIDASSAGLGQGSEFTVRLPRSTLESCAQPAPAPGTLRA